MTTNLTSVVLATITTSCLDYYNILLPYWTPASALNCIHFFLLSKFLLETVWYFGNKPPGFICGYGAISF